MSIGIILRALLCTSLLSSFVLSSTSCSSQIKEKDVITGLRVYTTWDESPKYKGVDLIHSREFDMDIFKSLNHRLEENESVQGYVKVAFIITERGELIGARIPDKNKDELSSLDKAFLQALATTKDDWEPAKYKGRPVSIMLKLRFNY